MYIQRALFAAAVTFSMFTTSAQAEDQFLDGVFVRGLVGASFSNSASDFATNSFTGAAASIQGFDFGTAPVVGFGLGYEVRRNFRVSIDYSVRTGFETDTVETLALPGSTVDADHRTDTFMLNGAVDLFTLQHTLPVPVTPFLTAGIGWTRNQTTDYVSVGAGIPFRLEDNTETGFAWQIGGGFGLAIAEGLDLEIGYRFVDLGTFESGTTFLSGTTLPAPRSNVAEITTHELTLALRYTF